MSVTYAVTRHMAGGQQALRPDWLSPPSLLHVGDQQAFRPEQRGRRILEHDARGFLLIFKSVGGPTIAGAAGSRITAARL